MAGDNTSLASPAIGVNSGPPGTAEGPDNNGIQAEPPNCEFNCRATQHQWEGVTFDDCIAFCDKVRALTDSIGSQDSGQQGAVNFSREITLSVLP